MYYLMKGGVKNEQGEYDGSFEWVIEADSIETAKAQLDDDCELDEIREISVEERIEREQKSLIKAIKYVYLERRFGDCIVREFAKKQRQMETDPEMFYQALKEFNMMQKLYKRLSRRGGFEKITIAKFFDLVNKLIDAKTEEEFNDILHSIDN